MLPDATYPAHGCGSDPLVAGRWFGGGSPATERACAAVACCVLAAQQATLSSGSCADSPATAAPPPLQAEPNRPPGFSSQAGPKEGSGPKDSLLLKAAQMKRDTPAESAAATMVKEEEEILKNITEKKALMSAKELAKGVSYTVRMETGCVAPALARDERNTKGSVW